MNRFERQIPIFGEEGQQRIMSAVVGVAGCGGLGVNVITQLAMAGVSNFVLCDPQLPEMYNLNRQFIYTAGDYRPKSVISAEWIMALNPLAEIKVHAEPFSEDTKYMFKECDIVIDCLDTFPPRMVLSDLCEELEIPMIHAGVSGFDGQIAVYIPDKTKTIREMIGTMKDEPGTIPSVGAAVSAIASMEALEALKVISGIGSDCEGKLVTVDMRKWATESVDMMP